MFHVHFVAYSLRSEVGHDMIFVPHSAYDEKTVTMKESGRVKQVQLDDFRDLSSLAGAFEGHDCFISTLGVYAADYKNDEQGMRKACSARPRLNAGLTLAGRSGSECHSR